jgi:hypothetical protein
MQYHASYSFIRKALAGLLICISFLFLPTFIMAADPELPPASYIPLPEGTKVRYDNWSMEVTSSEKFDVVYRVDSKWRHAYAVFGREGLETYSRTMARGGRWSNKLSDEEKTSLENFWPLQVGKKNTLKLKDGAADWKDATYYRYWTIIFEVTGTETILVKGKRYNTYIVTERGSGKTVRQANKEEYLTTYWYHPQSGLILKSEKDWLAGELEGESSRYILEKASFPKDSKNDLIALKETSTLQVASVGSAASDSAAWEAIKYSSRISDFQRYLETYPNGLFISLAENQIRDLIKRQNDPDAAKNEFADVDFGNYYALVIGINNYKYITKLGTAVRDAEAVAAVLADRYNFKVQTLIDPDRADIVDAFDEYRESLTDKDNLLIYYAGHGWLDDEAEEGYWLTARAKSNRRSQWVSNATITKTLKTLPAKHVMVVADSCYSGTLTRAAAVGFRDKDYFKRMASKKARVAMVSGGLEPVADDAGGGNSPFAKAFIDALKNNKSVIDGTRLFSQIRRPVILNAQQTPEYSDVRNANHDGGDFLFVRKQ